MEPGEPKVDALPALRIGEIVLQTSRYETMKRWYGDLLRIEPYYEREASAPGSPLRAAGQGWASQLRLCFFRLVLAHPYQQVVALFEVPGLADAGEGNAGLHHLQFRDAAPEVLARRYLLLKGAGIEPFRAMNHGPSSALYYRDPDGNVVEISVPNHARLEAYLQALSSDAFRSNPSGGPLDVEALLAASAAAG